MYVCVYMYIYIYIYMYIHIHNIYWLHCPACGILVLLPGIKPMLLAMKAWNFNHWTTREFPKVTIFLILNIEFLLKKSVLLCS